MFLSDGQARRARRPFIPGLLIPALLAGAAPARSQDASQPADDAPTPHYIAEGYPEPVLDSLARERRRVADAGKSMMMPFHLLVPAVRRWVPGQLVRVAFSGGTTELHERIEAAALAWIGPDGANLQLSFRNPDGSFRRWSATDGAYEAEIRIGFQGSGRWSHVGRDSINSELKGGRPGEASMMFGGFDRALPARWRGTVLHEFGHALGFEHEHQNPSARCGFRFYNDSGYLPSTDSDGWYRQDPAGKRPGLYTYLGGPDNHWTIRQVDDNIKAITTSSAFIVSQFDATSIMRYDLPAFLFEAGERSICFGERGETLSALDLAGARAAYNDDHSPQEIFGRMAVQQLLREAVAGSPLSDAIRIGAGETPDR